MFKFQNVKAMNKEGKLYADSNSSKRQLSFSIESKRVRTCSDVFELSIQPYSTLSDDRSCEKHLFFLSDLSRIPLNYFVFEKTSY